MKFPKCRELLGAIRALLGRRYTSRFPFEKVHVPEGFRGVPRFQEDKCIGCGACAMVCPAKDIEVIDEVKDGKGTRKLVIHYDDCIFCAQCHRNCPTGEGIVMTEEFDIASDQRCNLRDHVEKELVCCEICGEPVATRDHLLWIARRVGPSAYSNPTIMFPLVNTLMGRTGEPLRKGGGVSGRADRFRVLCPRHRREATIEFALEK